MNQLLFCFLFVSVYSHSLPPDDPLQWYPNFEQAQAAAQESNRHILLVFSGSDWCRPCMKLELELFQTPEFRQFSKEHFVLIKADFPRKKKNQLPAEQQSHNASLAEQFNSTGSFPYLVLIKPSGEVEDEIGYLAGGSTTYFEHWNQIFTQP